MPVVETHSMAAPPPGTPAFFQWLTAAKQAPPVLKPFPGIDAAVTAAPAIYDGGMRLAPRATQVPASVEAKLSYAVENTLRPEELLAIKTSDPAKYAQFMFLNAPHYMLYTPDTLHVAPDGTYLWIYTQDGQFRALRSYSMLEMGTKHIRIASELLEAQKIKTGDPILKIRHAGELTKSGTTIYFNLLSGTFMQSRPRLIASKYSGITLEDVNAQWLELARADLQASLPSMTVLPSAAPMNTLVIENISNAEKARLENRGFRVTKKNAAGGAGGSARRRRGSGKQRRTRRRR